MTDIVRAVHEQNGTNAPHGNWIVLGLQGDNLAVIAKGNGVSSLSAALKDDDVNFALLTLRLELQAIPDQPRNVYIHWKGPKAKAMLKVKSNQFIQKSLELLTPNHGQLEAIGKKEFTEAIITERWDPASGSHTIN